MDTNFAEFLAEALALATGEGAICVHVRGSLALLTEQRRYDGDDLPQACGRDYFHKLASWPAADKFAERDEAPLMKPQGTNGVRVDGWLV